MSRSKKLAAALAAGLILSAMLPVAAGTREPTKMYWGDLVANKIQRANIDGTEVEELLFFETPSGIAVDLAGGKLYFTDRVFNDGGPGNKIGRANLDGSGLEILLDDSDGLDDPEGLALDLVNGKMYWTDEATRKIRRADLDGANVEDLLNTGTNPTGIALDLSAGKMYWADRNVAPPADVGPRIRRANLDGSEAENIVSEGINSTKGVALDLLHGKIYFTDPGFDKVMRANLDGSDTEDLVLGQDTAWGIAVDPIAGKMYWATADLENIQRANLDGTEIEELVTGLSFPAYIALGIPAQDDPPAHDTPASGTAGAILLALSILLWTIRLSLRRSHAT